MVGQCDVKHLEQGATITTILTTELVAGVILGGQIGKRITLDSITRRSLIAFGLAFVTKRDALIVNSHSLSPLIRCAPGPSHLPGHRSKRQAATGKTSGP